MTKIVVCRGCEDRHTACHDHCDKYLQSKKDLEERKKQIEEGRKKDKLYADYKRERRRRVPK